IVPNNGTDVLTAYALTSKTVGGITISETSEPSITATAARIYSERFGATDDDAGASNTGVVVVNPSGNPATATFEFTDLRGNLLASNTLNVAAGGQLGMFLYGLFPGLVPPLRGILRVASSGPALGIGGLVVRTNSRGETIMAGIPPTDENLPPITSIRIFPH